MSLISAEDLILEANLGKQTDPAILEPHISSAEIEAKRILGEEMYGKAESYESSSLENEKKIFSEIKKGIIYLAMSYAVHSLNIETQGSGIVQIKGWDQSRSELLSRNDVNDLSNYFRSTGILFLQPYITEKANEGKTGSSIDTGNLYLGAL